jgi:hypothetical protein
MSILSEEIEAFHKRIRARALLMAIEWAGGAGRLSEMIGYTRFAGYKWLERVDIPVTAARALEKLPGFPVKASEMLAGEYKPAIKRRRRCPHCQKTINRPNERTGCSPSFNRLSKRAGKKPTAKRPAQAAGAGAGARPHAANTPARKRQSAA